MKLPGDVERDNEVGNNDVLDINAPDKHVGFDASYDATGTLGHSYDPDGAVWVSRR